MDPNVAPSKGSTTTPGETRSDLESTLRRIEARLERLERTLDPLTQATAAAPALTSTAVDVLDDWANQHGDLDERLRTLSELLERVTRPEALAPLMMMVELSEQAKPAIATVTDIVDETMARAAAEGMEIERLVESSKNAVLKLAQLATAREVQALLDSGMLDPVADASEEPAPEVGMFGALRAARQPSVKRALGFLIRVAEKLGDNLGTTAPKLLLNANAQSKSERDS